MTQFQGHSASDDLIAIDGKIMGCDCLHQLGVLRLQLRQVRPPVHSRRVREPLGVEDRAPNHDYRVEPDDQRVT